MTKINGAVPALTRSEVRRKRGRDNIVAEIHKHLLEVAERLRIALRALMSFILLEFWLMLLASARTRKFKEEREVGDGRDPTLKNMGALMLRGKTHCRR